MTEVTYIAMREGLNDKHPLTGGPSDAYKRLLQLAGCWEEPGGPGRPMGESSMEVSKKQEPASPAPVSPPPALEPPVDPVRPNPILPPESKTQTDPSNLDEEAIKNAIEVIRVEQRASVELLRRTLHFGYPRAVRILEELEKRGIVGPSNGTDPREILKLPERPIGTHVIKIGDEIHVEKSELKNPELATATAATQKADDKPKLPLGLASLRELFGKLKPTQDQMVPYLEDGGKVPQSIPAAVAKKLKFKPVAMFYTRGLTTITCEALGFRENLPENVALLEQMYQEHPWEELRASGLWLEAEKNNKLGRRPDAQFCGKGQIGRKPEKERRNKDDKWVWGYCSPVLIPYFDEAGDLIKLRPHKGGARGGTMAGRSRIYVPRDYRHCADTVEKFHRVIICEGEFKAAAVWQM
ncbi:MAG TPA: DNA translocase FtsK, partial [Candidatus Acidoferrum sp.]|nr:DNA translocase FtsK [Candidatus Acidoferrum sp.]